MKNKSVWFVALLLLVLGLFVWRMGLQQSGHENSGQAVATGTQAVASTPAEGGGCCPGETASEQSAGGCDHSATGEKGHEGCDHNATAGKGHEGGDHTSAPAPPKTTASGVCPVSGKNTTAASPAAAKPKTASSPPKTPQVKLAADEAACPIMGAVMKKSQMIPVEYKGKTYYMCCEGCPEKFNADPEKYIANPAPIKKT